MDAREVLRSELVGIYTAATSLVKRLRRRGAHVLAGQFTALSVTARKLHRRSDILLPTYRRQVKRQREEFERIVLLANQQYPGIFEIDRSSPIVLEREVNQSAMVRVTMPVAEWDLIDQAISSGSAKSRADYFRQLHYSKHHR